MLSVTNCSGRTNFKPLDTVSVKTGKKGCVYVIDGRGREYFRADLQGGEVSFIVGGALGVHTICLDDGKGNVIESVNLMVDCDTEINDEGGRFRDLLAILYYTMGRRGTGSTLFNGKVYTHFVPWVRDHVHVLKGMKYYHSELKSGMELYRDSQREDGMIWDNVYPRRYHWTEHDERFGYGKFIWAVNEDQIEFKRIPVENDVEYLYVEGIYYTWKATGDDGWMEGMLDSAIKAFQYSVTSPYRWSEKYGLLKRGFTIDTWDFQPDEDARMVGDDIMRVMLGITRFGVMFGDNTGFAASCNYLAEMLDHAGRKEEAEKFRKLSADIMERLNKLSWNGRFFTHHVPEDESTKRDLGVDQSRQISLSNAYSLNRPLTHEQCVAIINEYLKIKNELPYGSPGEWYTIYPPFGWGFEEACVKWEYMNGGVTPIVAGELAHGAFEHGFEEYGADILERVRQLAKKHNNYLSCCYKGALPEPVEAKFETIDISGALNSFESIPGWKGEMKEDYNEIPAGTQEIKGIPFSIPDPKKNNGNVCIGLSSRKSEPGKKPGVAQVVNGKPSFIEFETVDTWVQEAVVPVGRKARSVFLLHTLAGNGLAGQLIFEYADGTKTPRYIREGGEVIGWRLPEEPGFRGRGGPNLTIAWQGKNHISGRVGLSLFGLNNPHPDKEIKSIRFTASDSDVYWAIVGVTISDGPSKVKTEDLSYGIPDNWGAAAVVYALVEGLAGVVDEKTAFTNVRLSPRWSAAAVNNSSVTIKYPASGGYTSYNYSYNQKDKTISLDVAGNGNDYKFHCLLPGEMKKVSAVEVDGKAVDFRLSNIEGSDYVDFCLSINGAARISIKG